MLFGVVCYMLSQNIQAQRADFNFGDTSRPVPSVSSLSAYNNVPLSNATGIPGISIPLLELPSRNKNIPLNLSLSYNSMNTSISEPASDIGTGWSLFGGGVISRNIIDDFDEIYSDVTNSKYKKNKFNDIYYYNAPGISGKFKFVRDIATNTFELVNLSANKVKIEYTRTSNMATLILNSFTITNTNGNKYFFNDYSLSNLDTSPMAVGNNEYRSAFFLTKILDPNNIELANFTYEKKSKNKYYFPNQKLYEYCKLKTITSPGFGKIEFDYLYSEPWRMNDPFQIQKIVLKDQDNHIISGYAFEYSQEQIEDGQLAGGPMEYVYKRILDKIKKLDKNDIVSETTTLEYSPISYTPSIPGGGVAITYYCPYFRYFTTSAGYSNLMLKRIINPSGGVVEYNYEFGKIYKNRTDPTYLSTILNGTDFIDGEIQYLTAFLKITADTRQGIDYTFTIPGTEPKMLIASLYETQVEPPTPEFDPWYNPITKKYLMYTVARNGQVIGGSNCNNNDDDNGPAMYKLTPGNYTVRVFGTEGREGIAEVNFLQLGHIPQPFPNSTLGGGTRINNIKYYNSKTDATPLKTTRFEYKNFIEPTASSGYLFYAEMDPESSRYPLYKNVKVIDDDNGYTQYYYKTPDEYPEIPYPTGGTNSKFWPYYSITSGGLLDKKEVYNSQNKLLASEQSEYLFEDVPGTLDADIFYNKNGIEPKIYSKLGWLKKLTNTSTSYFENGRSVQDRSETDFNIFNFETAKVSKMVEGSLEEKILTYPETGYPNLAAANMVSIPVIVEEKIDGKLLSRTETKFTNPTSVNPTAIVSSNVGGSAEKTSTIDLYDEKGNVLQVTSHDGKKMTTIYGYYKTLPIAIIEGATYAQVSGLIQNIVNASDTDAADPTKEPQLLTALDAFRKHDQMKDFRMTTYTYDPLIGTTTVTSSNGMRETYKYDVRNRLEKVLDKDGMILKEYKYNYKN